MYAITARGDSGPAGLAFDEIPDPVPGPDEVVIETVASAVNRADLLQSHGLYPPPDGAPETIGLECSGRIVELGANVADGPEWDQPHLALGAEVCALLAGGGYATRVAVPAAQVMPVPDGVPLDEAASLPEVACTVWSNLFMTADLRARPWTGRKPRLLVHGGTGGIGSFAIQLAAAFDVDVLATAGSAEKVARCRELGAALAIDYRESDFVEAVASWSEPSGEPGVDVILDVMGAKYLEQNIAALGEDGRLVIIGMQGGSKAELDITSMLGKRTGVFATNLRRRPVAGTSGKGEICRQVVENVWPLISSGAIRTQVSERFPLAEAGAALARLESGESHGKLLLEA
ncbi:NAD(P)H-quinone oxidoreductase [Dietzia sp.]|uniref:NAD(P)H-quinone oxidoreductase n=1 Tax=Dietzia sp. TaxID=1871616 RepID=UPI002FDB4B15